MGRSRELSKYWYRMSPVQQVTTKYPTVNCYWYYKKVEANENNRNTAMSAVIAESAEVANFLLDSLKNIA